MDHRFASLVESLHPKFETLLGLEPVRPDSLPRFLPERGIYLFSEGDRHLYVGRTDGMRRRIQTHCRPGATHFTATFAFRIAREATGMTKATYRSEGSRSSLMTHELFGPAFVEAKRRVRAMDLRFVEEADPTRQALLEIYVATVLQTPYNDFENH